MSDNANNQRQLRLGAILHGASGNMSAWRHPDATADASANYEWSLKLLERFKEAHPDIPTKSGLMVGLGETNAEIVEVMRDLRRHGVTMLTLGQYLQPSRHHLPVQRYVSPAEFDEMKEEAMAMGFTHAACGPFVRSSYHADLQAKGMEVK